jgi:hypothetical protein
VTPVRWEAKKDLDGAGKNVVLQCHARLACSHNGNRRADRPCQNVLLSDESDTNPDRGT